ncbi:hypothetical protein F9B74_08900 [Pelistega sp. NLN82]|uniref:Uncharacterized protein n=1 Tax=Pelistega ratti TaxID=2652177 RepID=A0A6L9Y7R6_9BURK|nr:hypothetical protein [Pelistega ratti]NEN76426.1 hypothetical protein [Pelistega ratti]
MFLLAQFARYSFRDFLTFMEYFLNPLSIGIFFFYLIDLLRTFYFIDGLDECKESKNLIELNNRITSFTQEIINSDEVSKTINDIKSTTEKSKDIIKQYDSSKLKDISEKVKDTIKKFDD